MKLRSLLKPTNVIEVISALFILLFVYTGSSKLFSLGTLQFVLREYPLIGRYSNLIAWGLPFVEFIVVLFLLIPRFRLYGLYASLVLMSLFTIYLVYMFIVADKLPCTCGGLLQQLTWPQHLVFNLFFIALAIIAIKIFKKHKSNKDSISVSQVSYY